MLFLTLNKKYSLSLIETIFLSILFHAAFLLYIPSLNLKNTFEQTELNIDILISEPEPLKETYKKPEPIKKTKTLDPLPIKEIVNAEPIEPIDPIDQ